MSSSPKRSSTWSPMSRSSSCNSSSSRRKTPVSTLKKIPPVPKSVSHSPLIRHRSCTHPSQTQGPVSMPENIPEFVIPSLENYRRRQQSQKTTTKRCQDEKKVQSACQPGWRNLTDEECSSDATGMTLKHVDKTISSYGFPRYTGSPHRCSESVFHKSPKQDKSPTNSEFLLPGSPLHKKRLSDRSPVLYRHRFSDKLEGYVEPDDEVQLKHLETELALLQKSMNCLHRISFTSNISSANVLNVTVHELWLPSVKKDFSVFVRICLHIPGTLWKQCQRSTPQICIRDSTYCIDQSFAFNLGHRLLPVFSIRSIRLCFKVFYQCVEGGTKHFIGNVSMPYNTLASRSQHTRCLERHIAKNVSIKEACFDRIGYFSKSLRFWYHNNIFLII